MRYFTRRLAVLAAATTVAVAGAACTTEPIEPEPAAEAAPVVSMTAEEQADYVFTQTLAERVTTQLDIARQDLEAVEDHVAGAVIVDESPASRLRYAASVIEDIGLPNAPTHVARDTPEYLRHEASRRDSLLNVAGVNPTARDIETSRADLAHLVETEIWAAAQNPDSTIVTIANAARRAIQEHQS